jgi:pimeloyl-ACP methyl ester carboxylesterase
VWAVVEHEGPWRFTRHLPTGSQVGTFATMGSFVLRGRSGDAAEALLRSAYAYREGGTAWNAFPEEWRRVARENGRATLWDFLISIGNHPSAAELASIESPVVCSYGSRSPDFMARRTRSLAAAIPTARMHRIEGAAHAATFDAPADFVRLIADAIAISEGDRLSRR